MHISQLPKCIASAGKQVVLNFQWSYLRTAVWPQADKSGDLLDGTQAMKNIRHFPLESYILLTNIGAALSVYTHTRTYTN